MILRRNSDLQWSHFKTQHLFTPPPSPEHASELPRLQTQNIFFTFFLLSLLEDSDIHPKYETRCQIVRIWFSQKYVSGIGG